MSESSSKSSKIGENDSTRKPRWATDSEYSIPVVSDTETGYSTRNASTREFSVDNEDSRRSFLTNSGSSRTTSRRTFEENNSDEETRPRRESRGTNVVSKRTTALYSRRGSAEDFGDFVRKKRTILRQSYKVDAPSPDLDSKQWRYNVGTHVKAGALRPVLFLFYLLETILNLCCMHYYMVAFTDTELRYPATGRWEFVFVQYFYLITFYVFIVLTLFQSINVCTGHLPSLGWEIGKAVVASCAFILVSIVTMWDAERQLYLFHHNNLIAPFLSHTRGQAISSLSCGVIYMLHAVIMIDVMLTAKTNMGKLDGRYMPIPLYTLGPSMHGILMQYSWFREFCQEDLIPL